MFERVRYGRRDPEAVLRGCAAIALIFVGACTWLVGAIAMFGVSWLLVLLRALLAWLLADPAWDLVDELQIATIDAVEVGLEVEPLLYDPTDDLAELADAAPPAIPAPPPPPEASLGSWVGVLELASLSGLGDEDRLQMATGPVDSVHLIGVLGAIDSGDTISDLRGSASMSELRAGDGSSQIGGLIGARGTMIGSGGLGAAGVGDRGVGVGGRGTGEGYGTLGTMLPKARILTRAPVAWGDLAPSLMGRVCRVGVDVRDGSYVRVDDWGACPNALRGVIGPALERSAYAGTGVAFVVLRSPADD